MEKHPFSGFPIVISSEFNSIALGYITRANLARAIDLALLNGSSDRTRCNFASENVRVDAEFIAWKRSDRVVDMTGYTDPYPIMVDPSLPLDLLLDMFKALGLRVAIVSDAVTKELLGLVKKKDLAKVCTSIDVY